ncbi:MAG: ribosomal protein L7/L12, partial [Muribaculaceae bacterium]|nr:ribosomal protein L7/L12 [Muribaculaceae bacterium]
DGPGNNALVLVSSGRAKLQVVKLVKEYLGIGLAEAKDYVDSAPVTIPLTDAQAAELETYLGYFENAGATAYGTTI